MADENAANVDVLIVGAGPVGLALAVELGTRGISNEIIEQHERIGRQPRAKTTNVRTMEHMRRWGLAENVRRASPLPDGYANDVVFATRMFGHPIVRIDNAFSARPDRDPRYSEGAQWIPQYAIEGILRQKVLSLPACALRFGQRYAGLSQDGAGVEATVEDLDTGTSRTVRAQYLIGADGGRSTVREHLGFRMEGTYSYAAFCNLVLRLPGLSAAHPHPPALMYWLTNPDSPAVMGPMDRDDTWFLGLQLPDDKMPDEAALRRRVVEAIGRDWEVEILTIDPWFAHQLVADAYGAGRVFLAGDACHLHPPFGGFGMNLGVGDAVDLGWKLAATVQGWGGPDLLASYEAERRLVHRRIIDVAVANTAVLTQHFLHPDLELETDAGQAARGAAADAVLARKRQEFHSLGVVLGSHYAGSPVVIPDDTEPPAESVVEYTPSASPGCRAPHAWLADGRSLYDAFGPGFTLLVMAEHDPAEVQPLVAAAKACGIPLTVFAPDHDELNGLYDARFALIRPDQHVAWRGGDIGDEAASILAVACGGLSPDVQKTKQQIQAVTA